MTFNRFFFAIFLIATCALCTGAKAQNDLKKDCPVPQAMKAEQLFGLWAVRWTKPPAGMPATATLRLERHAEFSDSLAGTVSRDLGTADKSPNGNVRGQRTTAAIAGDLEDGMLLLDESSDNLSITGTWNGEMVKDSCGTLFQGTWKDTSSSAPADAPDVAFTLRKLP